jgi:hypothetical protein
MSQVSLFVCAATALLAVGASATTYYVATGGSDANAGTSPSAAFATLQRAANAVGAGDRVIVLSGTFAGFHLGTSGTAAQPIVFQADPAGGAPNPQVVITGNNAFTRRDTINLEGASHVVLEGFTVLGTGDPATHRACIRAVGSAAQLAAHVTVRGCRTDRGGTWGIFTGFVDDVLVERCEASRAAEEHGIYLSNSGDRPIVRECRIFGNHSNGIHLNGDASLGNDGIISGARIERNVIYDNGNGDPRFGAPGGSGINADGVVSSLFVNNLLYGNWRSGLSLYREDGGAPSSGNIVAHNTIVNASPSRWCLNVKNASTGNTAVDNIFYNLDPSRGSIEITSDCLPGFVCDGNALEDRVSLDDQWITLAQWRAASGQDARSFLATPAQLFEAPALDDYRLRDGSPALDRALGTASPSFDLVGTPRPMGARSDVGAYERPICGVASEYGTGLAGAGGLVARLRATGCGAIGLAVTLGVDRGLGGASGVLVVGASAIALPLLGGTLLASPDVPLAHQLAGSTGAIGLGTWSATFELPLDRAMVGRAIHAQALYLDTAAPSGLSMSAGLRLVLGG